MTRQCQPGPLDGQRLLVSIQARVAEDQKGGFDVVALVLLAFLQNSICHAAVTGSARVTGRDGPASISRTCHLAQPACPCTLETRSELG